MVRCYANGILDCVCVCVCVLSVHTNSLRIAEYNRSLGMLLMINLLGFYTSLLSIALTISK